MKRRRSASTARPRVLLYRRPGSAYAHTDRDCPVHQAEPERPGRGAYVLGGASLEGLFCNAPARPCRQCALVPLVVELLAGPAGPGEDVLVVTALEDVAPMEGGGAVAPEGFDAVAQSPHLQAVATGHGRVLFGCVPAGLAVRLGAFVRVEALQGPQDPAPAQVVAFWDLRGGLELSPERAWAVAGVLSRLRRR